MKVERYGEMLNLGSSHASPTAHSHPGIGIDAGTQMIELSPGRESTYCTAAEFLALFREIAVAAPQASCLNLSSIKHHVFAEENILSMLPEQISTVEISVCNRIFQGSRCIETYGLPKGLELTPHLSALIIRYPAHFCALEGFEAFMRDLNAVIGVLPNLRYVYFATSSDDEHIEDAPITREKMLAAISSHIPEYRFYNRNSATDELILTRPSTSEAFTPTPIARAALEAPARKMTDVSVEALEALASLSTFSSKKTRDISIEVVWQGPLKTITREYTSVTLHQNSSLVASFPISSASDSAVLTLGASTSLAPDVLEVRINYLKCSMHPITRVCRGRADGQLTVTEPRYIGEGTYKFSIGSNIEKGDTEQYRLMINNRTPVSSDRVEIGANLEPIDTVHADLTQQSSKSPGL